VNISAFDLNHAKALHFLLEEAHVGRAATRLGITPAAASNALRRLRVELGDPLLVKKGRGLVRSRVGEALRDSAREVVVAAERLLRTAAPFEPATFRGQLPIVMAEHIASVLLLWLDRLARARAPHATLAISPIPLAVPEWLERSGGVLVGPAGGFAVTDESDGLVAEAFYEDRYVCAMRRGHPLATRPWSAAVFAAQEHVLVTPRGRSQRSDVDEQLEAHGLSRRITRVVPSFTLALSLIHDSDVIVTIPERSARRMPSDGVAIREVPLRLRPLAMKLVVHPAHAADERTRFVKELLYAALRTVDSTRPARPLRRSRSRAPHGELLDSQGASLRTPSRGSRSGRLQTRAGPS
jgi:DNA-binding transcriptional LysR family regulator